MTRTGTLNVDPQIPRGEIRAAVEELVRAQPQRVAAGTVSEDEIRLGFLLGDDRQLNLFVVAISLGAVFFGACTYIGNGPNFMVKSLAESAGVNMPHFIPYILCFALPILLPIYILVWALFLR
jgi:Na+/H+ antiporter NhaD/arsenite permease-like protein